MDWPQEITELHAFFEQWFRGELPATDEAFERFAGVLAPGFRMVSPDGEVRDRGPLLEGLRAAHGGRPGIRIGVESPELLVNLGPRMLVSYREWQEDGGSRRVRVSTALLEADEKSSNGIRWLHVHETWCT